MSSIPYKHEVMMYTMLLFNMIWEGIFHF